MSTGAKTGNATDRSINGSKDTPDVTVNVSAFSRQKSKGRLLKSFTPNNTGSKTTGSTKKKGKQPQTGQDDKEIETTVDVEVEDVTIIPGTVEQEAVQTGDEGNSETITADAKVIENENPAKVKTNPSVIVEIDKETNDQKPSPESNNPNGDTSKQNGHVTPSTEAPPNAFTRTKSTLAPPRTPLLKKERTDTPDSKKSLTRQDSVKTSSDGTSRVSVDAALQTAGVVYPPEEKQQKSVISNNDSGIRSAIPSLPLWFAIVCLVMNVLVPGSGTILSGWSIFCCGKSRIQAKDDNLTDTLCVNIMVGVAQLFTVTFLFVGWFWSLAWGLKMVVIAVEYRHQKKQQRERELKALALRAFGSPSHVRSLFSTGGV